MTDPAGLSVSFRRNVAATNPQGGFSSLPALTSSSRISFSFGCEWLSHPNLLAANTNMMKVPCKRRGWPGWLVFLKLPIGASKKAYNGLQLGNK